LADYLGIKEELSDNYEKQMTSASHLNRQNKAKHPLTPTEKLQEKFTGVITAGLLPQKSGW
jgi:hypothetical protein